MTLTDQKTAARKAAFARRKVAHNGHRAGAGGLLSEFLAGHRSVALAAYLPIRTEINPLHAMAEASAYGPVGVPFISAPDTALEFHEWEPDCPMVENGFGTSVPASAIPMIPEIVIVPLVAFEANGNRLGYGGGFYDRTLQGLRARGAVLAVGFAYDEQETTGLPMEPTDQPLDLIITQSRMIDVRG
jgi:5-formyltetrahydrofolate cyclo-ligase